MRPAAGAGLVALLLVGLALAAALHLGPGGRRTLHRLGGVGEAPLVLEVSPGEIRNVRLSADAGAYVHVTVEQRGVDVEARLLDAGGDVLLAMDRAIGALGPEPIEVVTGAAGPLTLVLEAWPVPDRRGEVEVRLVARRPPTERDRRRSRALAAQSRAEALRWAGEYEAALAAFRDAATLWRRAGDPRWEAESLDRMAAVHADRHRWAEALPLHREAAERFAAVGDVRWRAIALTELATAHLELGQVEAAIARYREALPLSRAAGDRFGEATALQGLGHAQQIRLDVPAALDAYERALELWMEVGDDFGRATTLHNLGVLDSSLGRDRLARRRLEEAAALWQELSASQHVGDELARTLNQLARLALRGGVPLQALELAERSLDAAGRRRAQHLVTLAEILIDLGRFAAAEERLEEALDGLAGRPAPRSRARIHLGLGAARLGAGRIEAALAAWWRAVDLFAAVGEPTLEAEARYGIARGHLAAGRPELGLEPMRRALELVESVRAAAGSASLRIAFFATVQDHYSLHLQLLRAVLDAAQAAGEPLLEEGLVTAERARTRSLLDSLERRVPVAAEGGSPPPGDGPDALRRARERVELARRLLAARAEAEDSPDAEAARDELEKRLDELESARRSTLAGLPAAATVPSLETVRSQLLEPGTILLEYRLDEPESHLWVLAGDEVEWHRLPPASTIGALAREVHRLLDPASGADRIAQVRALCELGETLLAPVADRLDADRLLVVADRELAYLPFAALPDPLSPAPCVRARPLAHRVETVHLPSASVVAALRDDRRRRPAPEGGLAALADPLLPAGRRGGGPRSELLDDRLAGPLPPLPHSRGEVEAILALAPQPAVALFGPDAHKGVVTDGTLGDYRVLHFATHALVDPDIPELSRIALAPPPGGRPADGFLFAHEIQQLHLPADLVTLSACRSALGASLPGEGMVGFAWSFLYAGADRLLVSLWDVGDEETRRFMESFYDGLFRLEMAAGAALRRAQQQVLERGPRVPFHEWAAFLVVGDWHAPPRRSGTAPPPRTASRPAGKEGPSDELP